MTCNDGHGRRPRVSVLMTIYNPGPYLQVAVASVIGQTFQDWELIAVDDGSTDQSLSVLGNFSDARVKVFPLEKNIGRTPALRFALNEAKGDYIAVLDADDISRPDRLKRQVEYLDKNPDVGLVGSWTQYIDQQGKLLGEIMPPSIQEELQDCLGWVNPIVHSSAMYRRQLALGVGGYPEDLVYAQDFGLILSLAQQAKVAIIDDYLCQLRVLRTSMSKSSQYRMISAKEDIQLFKRAAKVLQLSTKARRLNRRSIAVAEIRLGIANIRDNYLLSGAKMALRALAARPSSLWGNGPVRKFFGAKF